jgi:hypothetical protein
LEEIMKLLALLALTMVFNSAYAETSAIAASSADTTAKVESPAPTPSCPEMAESVQCVDLKTNQVVKAAKVEAKQEVAATTAETTTVTKTVHRKIEKAELPPVPADLTVTGRSVITNTGAAVVVVPMAQAGTISGVNAAGEIITVQSEGTQVKPVSELQKNAKSEWAVTGHRVVNKAGQQVVVVPVAKPGYISGVTSTGEIVTLAASSAKTVTTTIAATPVIVTSPNTTTTTVVTTTKAAPAPAVVADTTSTAFMANNMQTTSTTLSTVAAAEKSDLAVEGELATANNSVTTHIEPVASTQADRQLYVMGVVGTGGYPQVSNVNGSYAISGAIGTFVNAYMFEAGFSLAKYSLDVRNYNFFNQRDNFDVNQYQGHLAAKYQFMNLLPGHFKPVAGALASYTYRQYTLTRGTNNASGDTGSSQSVDAGVVAGLDYEFDSKYAVGLDFKYMFNLSNKISATYNNPTYGYNGTAIEGLQYYTVGLSGRMNF